ncbi:MAG TPA: trypsin-like peptidase domain-containing protein [Patescibacteria group bacterium]|nr:trypsin-like peptidase domain-containing protein [Patescibacteria group bacterium]
MTHPHEPLAPSPAPDGPTQPAPSWPASSPSSPSAPSTYSPPAEKRPPWADAVAETDAENVAPPTPRAWIESEPIAAGGPPAAQAHASRRGRAGGGGLIGAVVAASLGAAVIGSLGTYGLLSATGALDREAVVPSGSVGQGQQAAQPLPITIDESSAITRAAEKVSPAIVTIAVDGSLADPAFPFFGVPQTGVGSGVIFDADGWIITNRHVVEGARSLTVTLEDGREFEGTIYGLDTLTDLAVVRIQATGLPAAPIGDSSAAKVGQLAIAIGSPLGVHTNSVTAGILSAFGRTIQVQDGTVIRNLIQTDAAINPGNSGGALLDAAGNVIGINTAVARAAEGIGFAIPINIARPIMQQALAGQELARPWIGIFYITITPAVARTNDLPVEWGAWLTAQDARGQARDPVVADSPAAAAGLRDGDIITAVDGTEIDRDSPLDDVLTQFAPGRTVALDVLRDGAQVTLMLTLGTRPATVE